MAGIFDAPIRNQALGLAPSKLSIFGEFQPSAPTASTAGGPPLDFVPTKQMTGQAKELPLVWIAAGAVALGAVGLVIFKLKKKKRR